MLPFCQVSSRDELRAVAEWLFDLARGPIPKRGMPTRSTRGAPVPIPAAWVQSRGQKSAAVRARIRRSGAGTGVVRLRPTGQPRRRLRLEADGGANDLFRVPGQHENDRYPAAGLTPERGQVKPPCVGPVGQGLLRVGVRVACCRQWPGCQAPRALALAARCTSC